MGNGPLLLLFLLLPPVVISFNQFKESSSLSFAIDVDVVGL